MSKPAPYIYSYVNESMPNIYKIGKTTCKPQERTKQANKPDTWKPPTPYVLKALKRVECCNIAEKKLHTILKCYQIDRGINREFFKAPPHIIESAWNQIDGVDCEIDTQYVVKSIIDKKVKYGILYYKVHWKGYPISESTWEPMSQLLEDGCKHSIQTFEHKRARSKSLI